ncbi:16S rRNA (cytidine(1402)-2'-O)-methyltransferase [Candidatus Avelusimicrobium fimicolum]|uniref:16S rRNA (cytidine(1402)-2'-O)-methyltransferase n=1 Tax=Candidatus Avelusimicrobium fimicolum TaxID=3416216 RepID=UPI003D0EBBDD
MLYIVPTPIGNLQDITLRALETLKTADAVLCEDTRRTQILLSHFGISKPLYRYNENDDRSVLRCLEALKSGKQCALVSDCGTPCISDPGWKLVKEAVANGIKVSSLPGPSAVACALAGAGITGGAFTFLGFLPRKPGKAAKLLSAAYSQNHPVVLYESPYRVVKMLELVAKTLGGETPVILARELSKVYEEWIRGTAVSLAEELSKKSKVQGEFVMILDRPAQTEEATDEPDSYF